MLANERSLKRGAVDGAARGAACRRGGGRARRRGGARAQRDRLAINEAADGLGSRAIAASPPSALWLVWRKGGALVARWAAVFERRRALAGGAAFAGVAWRAPARRLSRRLSEPAAGRPASRRTNAARPMRPIRAALGGGFSWRAPLER